MAEKETDPFVTMADMRAARAQYGGYCIEGAKTMCAQHGVDFGEFVRGRIRVSVLEATGDALVLRLAAVVRRRH